MTPKQCTYTLKVPASAIDAMGHVNNVVYLEWIQEAARKAWHEQAAPYFSSTNTKARLEINELAWVALDHHIVYKSPAYENEELEVSTFVKSFSGPRSERHTTITRIQDQKIVVTGVTNWCLLKMPEGKPLRISQEIIDLFL